MDLISRQAAIAVADSSDYVGLSVDDVKKVTDEVVKGLKQLPSAQPELGKNSPSEQHKMDKLGVKTEETCTDTISRQAAIDALVDENIIDHMDTVYDSELHRCKRAIERILSQLPSAQTDIVYCRECIHGAPNGEYGCRGYHYKLYEVHDMGANDFCSKGERRTDG